MGHRGQGLRWMRASWRSRATSKGGRKLPKGMHAAGDPWGASLGLLDVITMAVMESGKDLIRRRQSELAEGQGSMARGGLTVRAGWRRNAGTQEEGTRERLSERRPSVTMEELKRTGLVAMPFPYRLDKVLSTEKWGYGDSFPCSRRTGCVYLVEGTGKY